MVGPSPHSSRSAHDRTEQLARIVRLEMAEVESGARERISTLSQFAALIGVSQSSVQHYLKRGLTASEEKRRGELSREGAAFRKKQMLRAVKERLTLFREGVVHELPTFNALGVEFNIEGKLVKSYCARGLSTSDFEMINLAADHSRNRKEERFAGKVRSQILDVQKGTINWIYPVTQIAAEEGVPKDRAMEVCRQRLTSNEFGALEVELNRLRSRPHIRAGEERVKSIATALALETEQFRRGARERLSFKAELLETAGGSPKLLPRALKLSLTDEMQRLRRKTLQVQAGQLGSSVSLANRFGTVPLKVAHRTILPWRWRQEIRSRDGFNSVLTDVLREWIPVAKRLLWQLLPSRDVEDGGQLVSISIARVLRRFRPEMSSLGSFLGGRLRGFVIDAVRILRPGSESQYPVLKILERERATLETELERSVSLQDSQLLERVGLSLETVAAALRWRSVRRLQLFSEIWLPGESSVSLEESSDQTPKKKRGKFISEGIV